MGALNGGGVSCRAPVIQPSWAHHKQGPKRRTPAIDEGRPAGAPRSIWEMNRVPKVDTPHPPLRKHPCARTEGVAYGCHIT